MKKKELNLIDDTFDLVEDMTKLADQLGQETILFLKDKLKDSVPSPVDEDIVLRTLSIALAQQIADSSFEGKQDRQDLTERLFCLIDEKKNQFQNLDVSKKAMGRLMQQPIRKTDVLH